MELVFGLAGLLTGFAQSNWVLSTSVTDGPSGQQNSRGVRHRAGGSVVLSLATDPHELWFAGPRVLTDRLGTGQLMDKLGRVETTDTSGLKNPRERAAVECDLSVRSVAIREPPFYCL